MLNDGTALEADSYARNFSSKESPVDLDNKQEYVYEKYLNRP